MPKKEFIKICPKCGRTDILQNLSALLAGSTLLSSCRDCNYGLEGNHMFPEIEKSKIGEFKKMVRGNK